jgi:hypothetical protein
MQPTSTQILLAPILTQIIPTDTPITMQVTSIPTQQHIPSSYFKVDEVVKTFSRRIDLNLGDTLYLSAGQYRIGSELECFWSEGQVCVYIKQANNNETVEISNLTKYAAWLAVVGNSEPKRVLKSLEHYFWIPPNCDIGCESARIFIEYADGTISKFLMYPDGTLYDLKTLTYYPNGTLDELSR